MNEDFVNPLITEVNMILETSEVNILAVEGLTDYRFYENKVKESIVAIYDCNGRKNVVDLVKEFQTKFKNRIKGVCDRDFISFGIGVHKGKNILHTDYHDLEIDAVDYSNIESLFSMLLSEQKLKNKGIKKNEVRNLIINVAYILGHIRLVNEIEKYNIDFDNFKLKKGVAFDNKFVATSNGLLKCVLRAPKNVHLQNKIDSIEKKIEEEIEKKHDYKQICCGHDFMKILVEFIKLFGVGKTSKIPDEQFIGNIILGLYEKSIFLKSNLGKELKRLKVI